MSPYWIRPGAFDENVSRSLQKIFRIYAETARIRFSEVHQKQPTLYDTISSPGRRCYSDGRCVDKPEKKGGENMGEIGSEPTTSFEGALTRLKVGYRVARKGWNGKGMWLKLQRPDENSKMTHPYIYIEYPEGHPAYPNGSRVPWLASQTDLMAEDWTYYKTEGGGPDGL